MSNPTKAPTEPIFIQDDVAPDAYFEPTPEHIAYSRSARQVESIQGMLSTLDMTRCNTFVIPKGLTVDPGTLQSIKPKMATAKKGKLSLRLRSGPAREATLAMFRLLPLSHEWGSRDMVRAAMLKKVHVDGGAEYALGRIKKYYPKARSIIVAPPSRSEAEGALFRSGAYIKHLPKHVTMPFPLISTETVRGVKVNPKSDNGFPVLGQFGDPDAQSKVLSLAVTVRKEIVAAFKTNEGVWGWKERQEKGRPWLVTLKGKAKGDYYAQEKVNENMLRFYNALPRQIMLNMQVATQALEQLKGSILKDVRFHSCAGVALVRGGADKLVRRIDEQLMTTGRGYAHMGDDSWVALRVGDFLVMFALDCSSFDLTQHSDTTKHVHQVVREQLAAIDAPAADLWYSFMRKRNVVVAGGVVRTFKHAGPSGMPLQSLVNDILMDILIERAADGIQALSAPRSGVPSEGAVNRVLQTVGREMGFIIKVEQYRAVPLQTVHTALATTSFLFLGYYFHRTPGCPLVLPYCDIPRTMAQMPYPSLKWQERDMMEATEAMRLGSIAMSAGIPPPELFPVHQALVDCALHRLVKAIEKYGDMEDEKLQWAVQMSAFGPALQPSLSGLYQALVRGTYPLWAHAAPVQEPDEPELPSTSTLTWAEQADEEEEQERSALGLHVPAALALPDAYPLVGSLGLHIPTHPSTEANDGRPCPTAEWLPDRPRAPRKPSRALQPYANRVRHVLGPDEDEGDEVEYQLYPALDADEYAAYEAGFEVARRAGEYDSDAESQYYGSDDEGELVLEEDEYHRRMGHY